MMEAQRGPRRWIIVVYLGLLALVIPWYLPVGFQLVNRRPLHAGDHCLLSGLRS